MIYPEKFLTSLVSKFRAGRVISFSIYTFSSFLMRLEYIYCASSLTSIVRKNCAFYFKITSLFLMTSHAKSVSHLLEKKVELASKVSVFNEKLTQGYHNDAYERFIN